MNIRKWLLFSLVGLRGQSLGKYYERYLYEFQTGIPPDTSQRSLLNLFQHCEQYVPYYSRIIKEIGASFYDDPIKYLNQFPVLTKDIVRRNFDELKSLDLSRRKWFLNSTGGSTGEPAQFIQDWEYASKAGAIKLLFSKLAGKEIGECEVQLWGSFHDISDNTENLRARLINHLENRILINSCMMTPGRMRELIDIINSSKPKLIVTYVDPIYELAKFAESEGLRVLPQSAIMTSAGKLYPFMREKIEAVFQCKVFDRYGAREFSDMACEIPGLDGLWVAPWGNYIEIVDPEGNRVPDGIEGEILVTSLTNYAMPLIRYKNGDRGAFSQNSHGQSQKYGQVLREVIGRSMDFFKTQDGALINPGFFMAQLYFRGWIKQYQIIQNSYLNVIYRIVKLSEPPQSELDELIAITRKGMGKDCDVSFEFVDAISPTASGKYRFLMSEVH